MGLDQGQGQLGQFAYQLFEAAVFLSPLFGLGNQIHRHVGGVGFGFYLPGQIMAQMLLAWSCFWRAWRKRRIRVGCLGIFMCLPGRFYGPR